MRKIADTVEGNVLIEMTAGEWEKFRDGVPELIETDRKIERFWKTEAGRLLWKVKNVGGGYIARAWGRGEIEGSISDLVDIANYKIPISGVITDAYRLRELLKSHNIDLGGHERPQDAGIH